MIAKTPKQNVPEPAAKPSRPSVKFTAFELATITNIASRTQPTDVRFQPGRENRVNDRLVDVWTQSIDRTAKIAAITSWPTILPRLLSPRFRALRIPM